MKKIFVLGDNKVGKSTFAKKLQNFYSLKNPLVYEAGAWCRKIHKERFGEKSYEEQMIPEFREQLYEITREFLSQDSLYSFKAYQNWETEHNMPQYQILVGLRNIDDFNLMLDEVKSNNYCIFLANEVEMIPEYMFNMIKMCSMRKVDYILVNPNKIHDDFFENFFGKAIKI